MINGLGKFEDRSGYYDDLKKKWDEVQDDEIEKEESSATGDPMSSFSKEVGMVADTSTPTFGAEGKKKKFEQKDSARSDTSFDDDVDPNVLSPRYGYGQVALMKSEIKEMLENSLFNKYLVPHRVRVRYKSGVVGEAIRYINPEKEGIAQIKLPKNSKYTISAKKAENEVSQHSLIRDTFYYPTDDPEKTAKEGFEFLKSHLGKYVVLYGDLQEAKKVAKDVLPVKIFSHYPFVHDSLDFNTLTMDDVRGKDSIVILGDNKEIKYAISPSEQNLKIIADTGSDEEELRKDDWYLDPDEIKAASKEDKFEKAKFYIQDPSEAPKGSEIQRGERGGLYYEANGESKLTETQKHALGVRAAKDLGGQVPQKYVNQADKDLQGIRPTEHKVKELSIEYLTNYYTDHRPITGDRWVLPNGIYVEVGKISSAKQYSLEGKWEEDNSRTIIEFHQIGKKGQRSFDREVGANWLQKAVIQTPQAEKGGVDWKKVPTGASIWITVSDPSSPLHGRHVLVSRRPDNLFAVVGGAGKKNIDVEARKHMTFMPDYEHPEKSKADREIDREAEETRKANEPLIARKKELQQESSKRINEAYDKFQESVGVKKLTRDDIKQIKETVSKQAQELGISEEQAEKFSTAISRHYLRSEREIADMVSQRRAKALAQAYRDMGESKELDEDQLKDLADKLAADTIDFEVPNLAELKDKTSEEAEHIISRRMDERVQELLNPTPEDKQIDDELEAKPEDQPTEKITIGKSVNPLEIKDRASLETALNSFKDYLSIRREEEDVKSLIKPQEYAEITPNALENLRTQVRLVSPDISDEDMDSILESYDKTWQSNNSTLAFYDSLSDHWNDAKSLREKLDRADAGLGYYVDYGANSALSALSTKYAGESMDLGKVIAATNIEAAAYTIASRLREKYQKDPASYDKIVANMKASNALNIASTEKRALERHKALSNELEVIERERQKGTLSSEAVSKTLEINNLIEQKKNLGTALGSMQASSALVEALDRVRKAEDNAVTISFGNDLQAAQMRLRELGLSSSGTKRGFIDALDPNNIKIRTTSTAMGKNTKTLESNRNILDEYDKIKTSTEGAEESEDGTVFVKDYKVPGFKDTWEDEDGNAHEYHWRVEQRNDIEWLKKSGGGVISRVTGAGKTNTALGFYANKIADNKDYTGFCVVPKGRVDQWKREAEKFSNLNIVAIPEGIKKEEREKLISAIQPGQIAIVSHMDAVKSYYNLEEGFNSGRFGGLTIDEPQDLQSRAASGNMGAAGRKLMRLPSENRLALTATPARDNVVEAYDLVNWASHRDKSLGPRTRFKRVYEGFGAGTNAQDTLLNTTLFKEISPFISGDKLTDVNFKVQRNSVFARKSPAQDQRMKEIEMNTDKIIADRVKAEIAKVQSNPIEEKRMRDQYGNFWKARVGMKANQNARIEVMRMHNENLHGIPAGSNWRNNGKLSKFIDSIKSEEPGQNKHVIYVDSKEQRQAVTQALIENGYSQKDIKNIASSTGAIKPGEMGERVKSFQRTSAPFILIDKQSASGYNLQAGQALHVLGTPSDAANYLQAQGRLIRMPRKGDVQIKTYRYEDNPFENMYWNKLDNQIKILQATAPGLWRE